MVAAVASRRGRICRRIASTVARQAWTDTLIAAMTAPVRSRIGPPPTEPVFQFLVDDGVPLGADSGQLGAQRGGIGDRPAGEGGQGGAVESGGELRLGKVG